MRTNGGDEDETQQTPQGEVEEKVEENWGNVGKVETESQTQEGREDDGGEGKTRELGE